MNDVQLHFSIVGDYRALDAVKNKLQTINNLTSKRLVNNFEAISDAMKNIARLSNSMGNGFEELVKQVKPLLSALTKSNAYLQRSLNTAIKLEKAIKMGTRQVQYQNKFLMVQAEVALRHERTIKNIVSSLVKQAEQFKVIRDLEKTIAKHSETLHKTWMDTRVIMQEVAVSLHNMYKTIVVMIKSLKVLLAVLKGIFTIVKGIFNIMKTLIFGYFKIINYTIGLFVKALGFIFNTLKTIVNLVWNGLVLGFKAVIWLVNGIASVVGTIFNFVKSIVVQLINLPQTLSNIWRETSRIAKSFYDMITLPSRIVGGWADSIGKFTKDLQNVFFRIYTSVWMIKRAFGEALQESVDLLRYVKSIEALRSGIYEGGSDISLIRQRFEADTKIIKKDIEGVLIATGSDLQDVAKAMYFTVSNGITELGKATDVVKQAAWMAKISVSDVSDVLEAGTALMNAYNLSTKDLNDILRAQFELVRKGVLVYKNITSAMGKVYTSARNIGIGYQQLYGLVGYLSKLGISVDKATTALNTLFTKLATQSTVNNFRKAGIALTDTTGKYRDFISVLGDTYDMVSQLDDASRTYYLSQLHIPLRAQKAFLSLVLNYKTLKKYMDDYKKGVKNLDLAKAQDAFTNGAQSFTLAIGKLQTAWTVFTYTISDIVKLKQGVTFLNKLTDLLLKLTDYIRKNGKVIQEWVEYFAKMTLVISGAWLGLKAFSLMLNPFTGILMSILLALVKFKTTFSSLFDDFMKLFVGKENLGNVLDKSFKFIKDTVLPSALHTFVDFYKRLGYITGMGLANVAVALLKLFKPNSAIVKKMSEITGKYTQPVTMGAMLPNSDLALVGKTYKEYMSKMTTLTAVSTPAQNLSYFLFGEDTASASKEKFGTLVHKMIDNLLDALDDQVKKLDSDPKMATIKTDTWTQFASAVKETWDNHLSPLIDDLMKTFNDKIALLKTDPTVKAITDKFESTFDTVKQNILNSIQGNGGIIPTIVDTMSKMFNSPSLWKSFRDNIYMLFVHMDESLISLRDKSMQKLLNSNNKVEAAIMPHLKLTGFLMNAGVETPQEGFLPSLLYALGIGSLSNPKGGKLVKITESIATSFFTVMKNAITLFTTKVTDWLKGKDNFIDVAKAGAEVYGSIFDALTQSFLGFNLKTGNLLGNTVKATSQLTKDIATLYKKALNEPSAGVGSKTFGDILSDENSPLLTKLTALGKVVKDTLFKEFTPSGAYLDTIKNTATKIVELFVNGLTQAIKNHWEILAVLAAMATGNIYVIGGLLTAAAISLGLKKLNNKENAIDTTTKAAPLSLQNIGSQIKILSEQLTSSNLLKTGLNETNKTKLENILSNLVVIRDRLKELLNNNSTPNSLKKLLKQELLQITQQWSTISSFLLINKIKVPNDWISGWATGGFTPDVGKYTPAGIVHGGEWVAPEWMVKSQEYGPIIWALEHKRKGYADGGSPNLFTIPTNLNTKQHQDSVIKLERTLALGMVSYGFSLLDKLKKANEKAIGKLNKTLLGIFGIKSDGINNKLVSMSPTFKSQLSLAIMNVGKKLPGTSTILGSTKLFPERLLIPSKAAYTMSSESSYILNTLGGHHFTNMLAILQDSTLPINVKKSIDRTLAIVNATGVLISSNNLNKGETLLSNLGNSPEAYKYFLTTFKPTNGISSLLYTAMQSKYKASILNNLSQFENSPEFLMRYFTSGGSFSKSILGAADEEYNRKQDEANKALKEILKSNLSLDEYASQNKITTGEAIDRLYKLQEEKQNALITAVSNVSNTLGKGLQGLVTSMAKAGFISSDQLNSINGAINGVMEGGYAVAYGMKTATDIGTGNWVGAIMDGIQTLTYTYSSIGDLFGGLFKDNTKAIIDNTQVTMDLASIQRQIQQSTYNGNSNITIRITDSAGNVVEQMNTSKGYNIYDVSIG